MNDPEKLYGNLKKEIEKFRWNQFFQSVNWSQMLEKQMKEYVQDREYDGIFHRVEIPIKGEIVKKELEAKIDFIATDQGTGGAVCGNCNKCLDKKGEPLPPICPSCGAKFVGTSTYINEGGSDF
jgi:rubrerythrin